MKRAKRFSLLSALVLALALCLTVTAAAEDWEPIYPTGGLSEKQSVGVELPFSPFGLEPASAQVDMAAFEEALLAGFQDALENGIPANGIDVSGFGIHQDDIEELYYAVVYDNPEYYYVWTSLSLSYYKNGIVAAVSPGYLTDVMTDAGKKAFDNSMDEAYAACVQDGMTDLEIALALHDYLVLNCGYNWQVGNNQGAPSNLVYTAYGALVEGDAVCQGYALAYNALLHRAGIAAKYVSSEDMNHGWSLVQLDGEWYHVDPTWDDPMYSLYEGGPGSDYPGYVKHENFLLSDVGIEATGHYNYVVEGKPVTDTIADSDLYESKHVFNGALAGFFAHRGQLYYMAEDGSIQMAADDLTDTTPAAYCANYNVRWSAACQDGLIYYTHVEGHYSDVNTMDIYCYDIDMDRVDKVEIFETNDVTNLCIVNKDGKLQLLRMNGLAEPTWVHDVAQRQGTELVLRAVADQDAGTVSIFAYNGTQTGHAVLVWLVGYDREDRFLGVVCGQADLTANGSADVELAIPKWYAGATRVTVLLPEAGTYVPLLAPTPIER